MSRRGEPREIKVHETEISSSQGKTVIYGYHYSTERFERPLKKSFRISIHQSYREAGKVKKKQTVICTVGYYDIVDFGSWIGDYCCKLSDKAAAVGVSEDELVEMVYKKFQPLINRVEEEYAQTEEYAARESHKRTLDEYRRRKDDFAGRYGVSRDEYDQCYDVFGNLRNPEKLEEIKRFQREQAEYERRSREGWRSYYGGFYSNYKEGCNGSSSGIQEQGDREILKQFYRTLAKAFHPDSNQGKDTSEEMKVLNRLKSEWGL